MTTYTLAHEGLQTLVGRALIDPSFRRGLFSDQRAECLAEVTLTAEERQAASRIQADDLADYAAELDAWMRERSSRVQASLTQANARARVLLAA